MRRINPINVNAIKIHQPDLSTSCNLLTETPRAGKVVKIVTINDVKEEDSPLIGHMISTAKNLASELGIDKDGYRLVFNTNEDGGQSVYHIHLHLLGGRQMDWPPG